MAASPVSAFPLPPEASSCAPSHRKRRPYALTERRLAANRRNAQRSTGPRSAAGKARVARNPIKHGIFAAATRWEPEQHRDFIVTLDGLREDFHPHNARESELVATVADSFVRMAALLRFESLAALEYHQQCERELEQRIAAATPPEAARLEAYRENLRAAGMWGPTLPAQGEMMAILRYEGRLNRIIWNAVAELEERRKSSIGADEDASKIAKTNPFVGTADECPEPLRRKSSDAAALVSEIAKANPLRASAPPTGTGESEKTNPFDTVFVGNRHQRRRAEALARRQRR